jgi:hypothetical protein
MTESPDGAGQVAPKLLMTDQVLLRELRAQAEIRGASALSTRQLAELTGISRKTVARSFGRLARWGLIEKARGAYGNHPSHWIVPSAAPLARMTPGSDIESGDGMPDLFRRRDLQGPGALYEDIPYGETVTAVELLCLTHLTDRLRTIEWWLLVLGSQKWPLVSELYAGEALPAKWVKVRLEPWQWQENALHLANLAEATGRPAPKTRQAMQLMHQLERAGRMFRSGVMA